MQELLDKQAVCARLGISLRTLDTLVSKGEITPVRIGSLVRFSPSDLEAFVSGSRAIPPAEQVQQYLARLEALIGDLSQEQRTQFSALLAA